MSFFPRFDAEKLAHALSNTFAPAAIVGCTTAGEFSPQGMLEGSIVAVGFSTENFAVAARLIEGLSAVRINDVGSIVQDAFYTFDRKVGGLSSSDTFAVMLSDGLSQRENQLAAALNGSSLGAPLVGGSAADNLIFDRTKIIFNGRVYDDAAALVFARSRLPFCAFSFDYYEPTPIRLVVTKADPEHRIVHEFNAVPAALEYAKAWGLAFDEITINDFAQHPIAVRVGDNLYARAIKSVTEDGGLAFMSAVDEGIVFTLAKAADIIASIKNTFGDIAAQVGKPQIILGFECLFRRLDIEGKQLKQQVETIYADNRVTGFHTYGEQFKAMHLNQTLSGIAIGPR